VAKNNIAVFGLVPNRFVAELVISDLHRAGFLTSDISVLLPDNGATRDLALEQGTKAPEGAVSGGAAGGTIGGALGILAGIGAFAIPGIGPLIAAGPIMAALSGIAVGATAGAIAGALIGLGIPEIQAKAYEGKVKSGAALVSVHAEDQKQLEIAQNIFKLHGADDVSWTGEASVPRDKQTNPSASRSV
jgi:hypothetical protein